MPRVKALKEDDELRSERTKKSNEAEGVRGSWQMWHRNGTRCPHGTVPIRRSTVHDVLRAKSLFDFGKKQRRSISLARHIDAPDVVSGNGHEVSYLFSPFEKSAILFFIASIYINIYGLFSYIVISK
jgi:hypothetical protein